MDKRTRLLVAVVGIVVVGFLLDKFLLSPWMEKWARLSDEIRTADADLQKAEAILGREDEVRKEWEKVQALLAKPRVPDVQNHFVAHLNEIWTEVGVTADVSINDRPQQQGDFKEYVYEAKLKLPWDKLLKLLVELNNSREFVKVQRLGVTSQYEREDRLDVDLKVSTIEHVAARPR